MTWTNGLSAAGRAALGGTGGVCLLAGLVCAGAVLGGCRGERSNKPPKHVFPDMDHQARWDPQGTTTFFEGELGPTARPKPAHTVAFGYESFDPGAAADEAWAQGFLAERGDMLAEDDAVYRGTRVLADGTEVYVDDIPVRVSREMLDRGEERFNIYCATCHGYLGDGAGPVGEGVWSYAPANLLGDAYRDKSAKQGKDGYLFYVIREGVWDPTSGANRMPGYKHALDEMDSWAVVAYLRALQVSQRFDVDDLPESDRRRLLGVRGAGSAMPSTPGDAGAGGAGDGDAMSEGRDS